MEGDCIWRTVLMNQPIIFVAPEEYVGKTGYQIVDDDLHIVTSVTFEDGTPVPDQPPYGYRGADA